MGKNIVFVCVLVFCFFHVKSGTANIHRSRSSDISY